MSSLRTVGLLACVSYCKECVNSEIMLLDQVLRTWKQKQRCKLQEWAWAVTPGAQA